MIGTKNNLQTEINQRQGLNTNTFNTTNEPIMNTDLISDSFSPQIETITKTTIEEQLKEKNIRPRKRSRKQRSKKKYKITIGNSIERNWECEKKVELEKQIFELTLKNLREKYKNKFSNDEYIKKLEEEVCKLSVENIIQSTKVDVLNEERKQTQNLLFQFSQKNSKSKKKIKQLVLQKKKLKKQLSKFTNSNNKTKKKRENDNEYEKENEKEIIKEKTFLMKPETEKETEKQKKKEKETEKEPEKENFSLFSNLLDLDEMEMKNESNFEFEETNFENDENMRNEIENFLSLTEEYGFDPQLIFDEQDLSLLSSMSSPNFESQIQLFNKIYKYNRDQMKFSKMNPEYQKVEKEKILQFLNYLKKLNLKKENNFTTTRNKKNIEQTNINQEEEKEEEKEKEEKEEKEEEEKEEEGEEEDEDEEDWDGDGKKKNTQVNQKVTKQKNEIIVNKQKEEKINYQVNVDLDQKEKTIESNKINDKPNGNYSEKHNIFFTSSEDNNSDSDTDENKQNTVINDFQEWEKQKLQKFQIQMEEIVTKKINLLKKAF
ncbi:chascon isoform d-related [Anaeramoeba flamelloides]|uniref:Chascon isoform d-related n=1 Tax=Anaeramoeba flamelloides TaxID=1746091 RepID=A0AAV7YRT5_9EUKA|nr:chascon isoform d-related [Anaeramoeba flamelloides]